jgi:hypothetical protein
MAKRPQLSSAFASALRLLSERLAGTSIDWAIDASCSLALHGIAVDPHDIDLDTSAPGAYLIEEQGRELLARPVQFVASPHIRSHWGALLVNGVQVELIGGFQVLRSDGSWTPPADVRQVRQYVTLGELSLPVMPLSHVRDAYRLLGKTDKAALIDSWLGATRGPEPGSSTAGTGRRGDPGAARQDRR